jgi:hypothetical protein
MASLSIFGYALLNVLSEESIDFTGPFLPSIEEYDQS